MKAVLDRTLGPILRAHRWMVWLPVVLAIGLAVAVLLPSLARQRAEAALAKRTGMQVSVGSVDLGLASVSVEGVVLSSELPGARVTVARTEIPSSPVRLLWGGAAAVREVQLSGVEVEVDLSSDGARALSAARGSQRTGRGAGADAVSGSGRMATGRTLRVKGMSWRARDQDGEVSAGEIESAEWQAGRLTLTGVSATVGAPEAATVEMQSADASIVRSPEGWALSSCQLQRARLRLHPETSRDSIRGLRRRVERFRTGDDAAETGRDTAPDTDVAPTVEGEPVLGVALLSRLEPGVQCQVKDLDVFDHAEGAGRLLMGGIDATARENERGELKIVASGTGPAGGELGTDLLVSRSPLRIDGRVTFERLPLSLLAPVLPALPWAAPEETTIDADLTIATRSVKEIAAEGAVTVSNLGLVSPRIAVEPVHFAPVEFAGKARLLPLERRLVVDEASLTVGATRALVEGALAYNAPDYVINLDLRVPHTSCGDVLRAIPEALLGDLREARLGGRIRGRLHLALDSQDLDATELEVNVDDHCEVRRVPPLAEVRRFRQPFVHSVTEPDGEVFRMQTGPGSRNWTYLEDISPFLVHAVLAHEDAQFFNHNGFSPPHIRNALVRNLKEGRYVVGASTITMQLVKNVFLHREKTLARKVQEVLLTWWVEQVFEKRELLELYLNVIEYGPAVYGLRHASDYYFKRLPSDLSPAEAVFLSTILPNPKRYHGMYRKGALSSGWKDRMRAIFRRMRAREWYTTEAVDYGLAELEHFRFYPAGQTSPPRGVPGGAAPLPYQHSWGDDFHDALDPGPSGHLDLTDF